MQNKELSPHTHLVYVPGLPVGTAGLNNQFLDWLSNRWQHLLGL